jgi:branched-chain amino acid aminotransferase
MVMTAPRVWVNGRLWMGDEPGIAPLDHGLVVGDGVFEATKIVDGHPFALTRHHDRMARSLGGLGLPPVDRDRFDDGIRAVLAAGEPIAFGKLRFWVTGGVGPLGSDRWGADHATTPSYLVAAEAIARPPGSTSVAVVPWTRNERAATAGLKTTSYADNVVALAAAKRVGASEAVFANTQGELCEGTGSNVFVVIGGEILTPSLDCGPLPGVTRDLVIQWAREAGMPIHERRLPLSVLYTADEVFLTSSTRDVQPVHAIDERLVAPGPMTAQVGELFVTRASESIDP